MFFDKGFHNGSVSWQLHDHEVAEVVRNNRRFERIWVRLKLSEIISEVVRNNRR